MPYTDLYNQEQLNHFSYLRINNLLIYFLIIIFLVINLLYVCICYTDFNFAIIFLKNLLQSIIYMNQFN